MQMETFNGVIPTVNPIHEVTGYIQFNQQMKGGTSWQAAPIVTRYEAKKLEIFGYSK
jgi:hypothetical protein